MQPSVSPNPQPEGNESVAGAGVDVSAVIVTHNSELVIAGCLRSLREAAAGRLKLEVVVIDNGSCDQTVSAVMEADPDALLVQNRENLGFAAANNCGLDLTSGRYVLFLNPDTVVANETLTYLTAFMDRMIEVGAASCFVRLPDGTLDDAAHRGFPTPWNALCHFAGLARIFPKIRAFSGYSQGWKDLTVVHEVDAICGCFMLVRREAGIQAGWWDEEYFFYGEDLDLCYRLKQSGWAIYFVPDVWILHYKGVSSGIRGEFGPRSVPVSTSLEATHHRFEAMRIFYRKHLTSRYPAPVTRAVVACTWLMEWGASRKIRRRGPTTVTE